VIYYSDRYEQRDGRWFFRTRSHPPHHPGVERTFTLHPVVQTVEPPAVRESLSERQPGVSAGGAGRLLALEEIRLLALRFASAVTAADSEALLALFTDSDCWTSALGFLNSSSPDRQPDLTESRRALLSITTHGLSFAQDEKSATGCVYYLGEDASGSDPVAVTDIFLDNYERIDGEWLFSSRRHAGTRRTIGRHNRRPLRERSRDDHPGELQALTSCVV
jgi:hypothetical protein